MHGGAYTPAFTSHVGVRKNGVCLWSTILTLPLKQDLGHIS
jgi:hypothetical protein